MTKIRIERRRGIIRNSFTLCMEGHADFDPGNDIVCAALSAFFFALANYLDDIGAAPSVKYESGRAFIKCKGGRKARFALEFVIFALYMLEARYPGNVKVYETPRDTVCRK